MELNEIIAFVNLAIVTPIYFIMSGIKSDIKELRSKIFELYQKKIS